MNWRIAREAVVLLPRLRRRKAAAKVPITRG
jgi:hypothetical protein